jgi:hypothetical protein
MKTMILEQIIYMVYIYSVIATSIFLNPSILVLCIVYLYTYLSTLLIYNRCNCYSSFKHTWITVYSCYCVLLFYGIHVLYHEYHYRYIFISFPFIYLICMKTFENYFKCDRSFIYSFLPKTS